MLDLRVEVTNALHWDLAIPRDRITVEVDNGLVTLRGIVKRAYQRACAEATARRVSGVTSVRNNIAVRAPQEFSQSAMFA